MPKPQDIFQLAQQEAVRVTASPQAWQSFLYTAAHNYHTTYLNQLLIHAQRPDAAACASMEYWNTKANRLVMRGSRSITVLQRRQGVAVTKPVFAIGDTTLLSQTHTGGPWEVTDTTRLLLLQGKPDDWLTALAQDGVSNEADRAHRMLERNVADSTLQWAQPDEQMQLLQALVTQSAVYMARLRIGLPEQDEDYPAFQSVSQFDTYQISLCLGGYLQAAAEPMLDAIGREALRLNRDSIAISHEPVHNESTPTQLNSREEAVTHDVHEEPRRLPDSEPFPAEPAEPVPEPLREAASGLSGAERADALRPADAGGHAADELQPNRTDSTADGGQDPARADADHPDAGPHDEPAGLGTADQQPEEAGGGSSPSDAVRNLTESPAQAESEQSPSAFALPEFSPTLLPQLLAMETSSRAYNAEYLTFYNKNPLLIDRLRFVRESYKDIFTELLLADDTRVGFHRQDNGLLVWQGAYLTRSAETLLSWRAVANALNDLIEQHELIAAIDPKKLPQVEEQLSFELPDGSPPSAENNRLEKDDFLTPEKQENVIRSALPVAEYNAPQMDDGSVITDEEVNLALAAGSNFENSKFRIYQQFTTTQGDHAAFLKKEYGSGGRSWDYQSGAHGWVDHGPAGLKLILTNEEGRFERRLPWRGAAKRIAYLIEMQRFLTQQELEQYPAWAAEQREVASVARDEPGTIPDTRPICAEGSVVYLEDDHRFTVERIGQFDVHLRDEEAPLFGRAISREEFQRQLDANPRNGGMMLSEQQHEALVQAQTEQALSYIEDYLKDEFEITEPDFSNLTRIDLGYTTTEDEKHVIQVYADLEHCTVTKLVDDTLYAQERYGSLDDLNQAALSNLDFDSLMEIDLDEVEEHEPQENALPTDESAAQAPTNYLAPYEPEVPAGAKAKFTANLNAIRTLKQIEQRGTPATEAEQDVLAGYLGWGGLADAFDPNKDSWHSEYMQLKELLTPEEYAAAQESTLTAFYTPPAVIHAMYRALTRMGCVGGNVLEPSMGVGAFFGHRSGSFDTNNAKLYGVELDSVSGRIAQQLYQKAKIQICGYEKADLPDSFFDLATLIIKDMDQAEAVQEIEKKLAYMHKEEYDAIAKARERNMPASIAVSYDLKSKMHHTEQMMDDITTKNQKIFKVCILIHTYGDSNAQLDERVRRICSTVQQQTCRFDSILYEQRNAMNSMLPLGKKWLGLERTLETVSTAIYVPFTTQELFQPGGLYEGINARSKNLILCNRKLLPAPAGMVLGMTGYGKSFSVMQMVTNIMLRWPDDDIVLIDPEQEYTHLVTAMGGVVIDISASSPSHINPMDITEDYGDDEDPIRLKSQFLQNFCQLILHSSELSPQERTFIDVAAGLTYQRYMANPKREEMPTLHDFYRNLALQGEEVKPLLTALKLYVSGSMDLFAHQTNVNVQNHCICFNTVKLGKSMQSIGMLTVLDQVWNRITRNRVLGRRTWVFTDEFQQLLGNKDCTDFYFQLSSRARKWGAILTSITQHVRSVLDNEDARRMLSDCGYIKLLNQSPDDANDLARLLHISNEEKRYIENSEVGSGLLIVSKTVVPFNNDFPKDTELFRLMDTSPNRKS